MSFQDLNLHPLLLQALASAKYTTPTEIQSKAIPVALERKDILGCAQTGTGKTAAFVLPILHQMLTLLESQTISKKELKCLILAPTRELAIQIHQYVEKMSAHTSLRHAVIYGGIDIDDQIFKIKKIHPQLIIATPGRLLDLYSRRFLSLKHIKFLVLDEADRMLDLGFKKDLQAILKLLPASRQTLMFSATVSEKIQIIAKDFLKNPVHIEVAPTASTSAQIEQWLYPVHSDNKNKLMVHLIKKLKPKSMIVFTKTKAGADRLTEALSRENIISEALHSDRSQQVRIRLLEEFKRGKLKVLVATDIAARGLDIQGIEYVVNFDVPLDPEVYVHRVGRTGRAEASGEAFTLVPPEDWNLIEKIQKVTQQEIPVQTQHPFIIPLGFMNKKELEEKVILPPTPQKKKKPTSKERKRNQQFKGKHNS